MYRVAIEKLYKWKESKHRKPLIIEGARQVGKTWLMKEFANKAYENTLYINFVSTLEWRNCLSFCYEYDRLFMGL
jgi:predicted AAA+ superfamily ATPase